MLDDAEPSGDAGAAAVPAGVRGRRRIAPLVALGVAVVFAVFFAILAGSKTRTNESNASTPLLGMPAPSIVGETLDGGTFDLARRRGSWVVLNFFQTTCLPCQQEHPELVAFDEEQAARPDGAELVTIVWQDNADAVRSFFAEHGGGTWPVVLDDADVNVRYGVARVPETWIIDPAGVIRVHYVGAIVNDGPNGLSAKLDELRSAAP